MSKDPVTLNTVEEMVTYTLENARWLDTERWSLEDRNNTVADDPEYAAQWSAEADAYCQVVAQRIGKYVSVWNLPDEDKAGFEEIESRRPKYHNEIEFHLRQAGNSYHSRVIWLSVELGTMLDEIWKHKPLWEGSSYDRRIGVLTMAGMLKRLGAGDVSKQIEAQKKAYKEQEDKNRRNSWRKEMWESSTKFLEQVDRASKIEGCLVPEAVEVLKFEVAKFLATVNQEE